VFKALVLESGDPISIDGREGSVYRGMIRVAEA
jgi:phosphohistidine swiveling domain-containing protein